VRFFIFAAILVLQIFMLWKWILETTGRSMEEIESIYYNKDA